MSAPPKDGGPAFPYAFQHEDDSRFTSGGVAPGMTLRDWFAGQAIAGLAMQSDSKDEGVAMFAYQLAEAMLAARERKERAT